MMARWSKVILLAAILALCWGVCLTSLVHSFPVGLHVDSPGRVGVSAVSVFPDGQEVESAKQMVAPDCALTFNVERRARTFCFRFHSCAGSESGTAGLRSIDVLGIPIVSANLIPGFDMRVRLYDKLPKEGGPLVLEFKNGDVLDLPNVFPFLTHVATAALNVLAWFPFAAVLICFLICRYGSAVACWAGRLLDSKLVFAFLLFAVAFLTMPPSAAVTQPGLDPSWEWLFNRFAFTGQIGSGFVFTYGPLGFLIRPQYSLLNVCLGIVVNGLFSLLFAAMVWIQYRGGRGSSSRRSAYLLMLLWCLVWPNGMEWKWYAVSLTVMFMACVCKELPRGVRYAILFGAALSAMVQSFVKFSSCLMVLSQQAFMLLTMVVCLRERPWREIGVYLGVLIMSAIAGVSLLFPDFMAAYEWLIGSIQISSGYNLYMGGDKSWFELSFVAILLAVIFLVAFCGKGGRKERLICLVMFAPTVYLTFKYAIVRQNICPLAFLTSLWACLCLVNRTFSCRRAVVLMLFCIGFSSGVSFLMYRELPKSAISIANLRSMVNPSATLQMNAEIGAPKIDEARIPDAWLRLIGTNSVMIVGDEMGPAMSGDLNLVPFPATQTYSAYTPYLDVMCAERIQELKLPYLMVPANPRSFDSRNIYFDNPRLWTAVRRMYEYVDSNAAFVLLRRRDSPIPSKNTGGVFDLQRSVGGKLTSLFLRTPRTQACFRFEDGSEYSCSANVEILDGMPVPDVLPVNPEDVPSFFGGKGKCPRVVDVRIAPANSFQLTGKLEYADSCLRMEML